jgi:uncharacterized protein (DUF1330 family)
MRIVSLCRFSIQLSIQRAPGAPRSYNPDFNREEAAMAKGYWIVRVDIRDMEQYKSYIAANAEPLRKFGGRFVVRGGTFENPEGTSRARNAVIEFPTYRAAVDCWHSPEYQAAIKLRESVSTADLVIIEGYDGPQP